MPSWVRIVAFLVPVFLLIGGIHFFVYRRMCAVFAPKGWAKVALAALLTSGPLCLVLGRTLASGGAGPEWLIVGATVYGAIETLAVVLAAALLIPVAFGERLLAFAKRRPPSVTPELPRREFLGQVTTGSALFIAGGTSLHGGLFGRHDYRIEEIPIALPGLPRTLDGYSIVQLSDIHVGTFVQEPELRAAEALVRSARPDLIVMTGDLVDHDPAFAPKLGALVRRLDGIARDGVVAIPGNHDYYAGIEVVLGTLRGAGAKVLVNQGRVIGDRGGAFALLGVDDVWAARNGAGGPDLDRALAMVPRDLPSVLLCHNPEFFPAAASRVGLQLSGHTHGGQIAFGINPAELVLPHGYVRGHYTRGTGQLYVNRGFGTAGPPSRIGSPPEITRVVLVSA
ncbi:MAG: metallophosphoesterase [Polyangiaceae bacterium]|nr:metallophosphoesterase [Polyangiaceae bacterium]